MSPEEETPSPPLRGEVPEAAAAALPAAARESFWQKRGVYLLGVLLAYVGVGWSMAIGYSSIADVRLLIGFIFGPILATPLAVLNFAAQWLLRKLVRRFAQLRPWPEALILNLPVAVLVGVWVVGAYAGTTATSVFERYLAKPMPSSVHVLKHGGGKLNISEGVRVGIHFEIEPSQLETLIRSGGFKPKPDDRGAGYWSRLFSNYARLNASLAAAYSLYVRESRHRTHRIPVTSTENGVTSSASWESVSNEVEEYLFCTSNSLSVLYLRLAK